MTEDQLLDIRNFGQRSVDALAEIMQKIAAAKAANAETTEETP